MDAATVTAWISPGLLLIGMVIGVYVYVSSQVDSVRREAALQAEKVGEAESKARHSLASSTTAVTTKIEADLDRLRRDTVRREDHANLEARLTATINEVKTKLDALTEKLSILAVLKAQTEANGAALARIADKLEQKPHAAK